MATEAPNFYERWLKFWEDSQAEKKASRSVIHDEELEWVTPQDYSIALMAGARERVPHLGHRDHHR